MADDISDQILEEGAILVGELDELDQATRDLRGRVAEVSARLADDRQAILAGVAEFRAELAQLIGEVQAATQHMGEAAGATTASLRDTASGIGAQRDRVDGEAARTATAVAEMGDFLGEGTAATAGMAEAYDEAMGQRGGLLAALRDDVGARGQASQAMLEQFRGDIDELRQAVALHVQDLIGRTTRSAVEFSQAAEGEVFAPARRALEQLNEHLRQISAQLVTTPVEEASEQLKQQLESELAAALDELRVHVERAIDEIAERIRGGSDGISGKRGDMEPLREQVEALFEPIRILLDNVIHIAKTVGFTV